MRSGFLFSVLGIVASTGLAARADTIVIDGNLNEAAWATATTTHVAYDAASLEGNFGQPGAPVGTTTDAASYTVKSFDDGTNYYVGLSVDPGDANAARVVGDFANLYFDTDPQNGNGSDVGFETGGTKPDYFNPNLGVKFDASNYLKYAVNTATNTIELSIANSFFTDGAPGVTFPLVKTGNVTLRLSQSFGYSVVGGDLAGNRLGTATVVGTPLPTSAAGSLFLLAAAGAYSTIRRRFRFAS